MLLWAAFMNTITSLWCLEWLWSEIPVAWSLASMMIGCLSFIILRIHGQQWWHTCNSHWCSKQSLYLIWNAGQPNNIPENNCNFPIHVTRKHQWIHISRFIMPVETITPYFSFAFARAISSFWWLFLFWIWIFWSAHHIIYFVAK